MAFVWRYLPAVDVTDLVGAPPSFSNQSDAETWIGESWRALADAGVESAALYEDGTELYQMALSAD
jgi:hypothetical protein